MRKRHLLDQRPTTAVSEQDDQVHRDKDQLVVPAVGLLAPEPDVPDKDFLLNRAEHDEDESDGRYLSEHAAGDTQPASDFGNTKNDRETLAHADAFGALGGFGGVAPAAGDEDRGDHQAKEKDAEVGELGELGEHKCSLTAQGR